MYLIASGVLRQTFSVFAALFLLAGCLSTDNEEEAAQINRDEQIEQMLTEWQEAKGSIERLVELEGDFKLLVTAISNASTLPNSAPPLNPEDDQGLASDAEGITVVTPDGSTSSPQTNNSELSDNGTQVITGSVEPDPLFNELGEESFVATDKSVRVVSLSDKRTEAMSWDSASDTRPATIGGASGVADVSARRNTGRTVGPATRIEAVNAIPLEYSPASVSIGLDKTCENSSQDIGGDIALHLMSISDFNNVQKGWQTLREQFSDVLCNKQLLVKNVMVKGQQYYSLRVGSYSSYSQAMQTCATLKARGQYCSLTQYSGTPISEYD